MNLFVRGLISNSIGIIILLIISQNLNLSKEALISISIQWLVFIIHGIRYRSEKYYDISGSLSNICMLIFSLTQSKEKSARQIVNSLLIVVWMTRLGTYLFTRILKDGRDERFIAIKTNFLSFLGVWTLQALWVFLIDLPDIVPLNTFDVLAWALWIFAFLFETLADAQKFVFNSNPANKNKFITTGLWKYSRHPNYFGEILMWIAICLSTQQSIPNFSSIKNLQWISPIFTYLLLTKVSGVPLLEKIGMQRWGSIKEYQNYVKNTNCIIPGFFYKEKQ